MRNEKVKERSTGSRWKAFVESVNDEEHHVPVADSLKRIDQKSEELVFHVGVPKIRLLLEHCSESCSVAWMAARKLKCQGRDDQARIRQ